MNYTEATFKHIDDRNTIVWQGCPEDGIGEEAIHIQQYNGMIEITQNEDVIIINNETLKTLEKIFRSIRSKNLI